MATSFATDSASGDQNPDTPQVQICILKWGCSWQYTIPSFSVLTIPLRHAEIQVEDSGLLDVFFHDEPSINNQTTLPLLAAITEACLIEARKSRTSKMASGMIMA